jgi:cell division protein FtsQ
VQQATVMRFLPNRLSVSIVERTPVAFVREGSQVELADADGVILSMPPLMMAQHHYSFPVVTGIDARDSLASRRARMAVYLRFLAELDKGSQHLTQQVSEIDLSDPEDLRATMPEQGSDILAHFGEDHFLERWQSYKSHIGEWRSRYPRLIGVDLRYNGEIPLEMAPDQGTGTREQGPEKQGPEKQGSEKQGPGSSDPGAEKRKLASAASGPAKTPKTEATPAGKTAAAKPSQAKAEAARKAAEARRRAARLKAAHEKAVHGQNLSKPASDQQVLSKQGQ